MEICGDALIGTGHFTSHIDIPEQAPFPAAGRMLAFNSEDDGQPARSPPTSTAGTRCPPRSAADDLPAPGPAGLRPDRHVEMPKIGNEWGYVNGFDLTLSAATATTGGR